MTEFGYAMMTEQGHSGYAWAVLGAAAQATRRTGLMTYVTCPTVRYHPAIVAEKAATAQTRLTAPAISSATQVAPARPRAIV